MRIHAEQVNNTRRVSIAVPSRVPLDLVAWPHARLCGEPCIGVATLEFYASSGLEHQRTGECSPLTQICVTRIQFADIDTMIAASDRAQFRLDARQFHRVS